MGTVKQQQQLMGGERCNTREWDKQCVLSICMQDDKSEGSQAQSGEALQVMSACSKVIVASTVQFNSPSLLPSSCWQSVSSFTGRYEQVPTEELVDADGLLGRLTPCLSTMFSAMTPNPVSFTAFTTVCHVRGRVPVPAWLEVHLPNKSSIQSAGLPPLPVLMASMIWYSTCRKVPKCLHCASSWWFKALIMSVAKGEKDRISCMCSKAHCSSTTDSPAVSGAGGVRGGRVTDVAASETDTVEGGSADGSKEERDGDGIRHICIYTVPHKHGIS